MPNAWNKGGYKLSKNYFNFSIYRRQFFTWKFSSSNCVALRVWSQNEMEFKYNSAHTEKRQIVDVKEVIFQTKEISIALQKLILLRSPGFHQDLLLMPWFSWVGKACFVFCRINDTLPTQCQEMLWVDADLMKSLVLPWNNTFTNSCAPADLGHHKNHVDLLLYCPCLENLGVCSARAPTEQLPAASSTEWCLHCWAAPEILAQTTCNLGMQGHAHSRGTVPLPFSPHRKGQKRREKARNQCKRKEWSNEQHICDNLQRHKLQNLLSVSFVQCSPLWFIQETTLWRSVF